MGRKLDLTLKITEIDYGFIFSSSEDCFPKRLKNGICVQHLSCKLLENRDMCTEPCEGVEQLLVGHLKSEI